MRQGLCKSLQIKFLKEDTKKGGEEQAEKKTILETNMKIEQHTSRSRKQYGPTSRRKISGVLRHI